MHLLWQHPNRAQSQLLGPRIGPWLETMQLGMSGHGKGSSPEVPGSPGHILQGAGGPARGAGGSHPPPRAVLGAVEVGRERWDPGNCPASAFQPLQARGFNLITCFICANLFFNQSCSTRRKAATVGSIAPPCSKGEVNGSYPGWRCLQGCGPGPLLAGEAQSTPAAAWGSL